MTGARIVKLEKFFKVRKAKDLNELQWLERLHEMALEWEEENGMEFPL